MWDERLQEVKEKRLRQQTGDEQKIKRQHEQGKYTVRERIEKLLDADSFVELFGNMETDRGASTFGNVKNYPGDGIVTGWGKIEGRYVCVAAEDFTVIGGTLGVTHAKKIIMLQDFALSQKIPIIFLNDSGGARIEEGINALSGYGEIFQRHVVASGVIPQICAILGPCSGGACYSPALCDFIFCVDNISKMFITGPAVVESVLGTRPTLEELGGAAMHSCVSGVVHGLYANEDSLFLGIRKLISLLPANNTEKAPFQNYRSRVEFRGDENFWKKLVPDNARQPYNMLEVIGAILDGDPLFEIQKNFARNVICGFGTLRGEVIGVIANQPMYAGGALDCDASDKMARFIQFCDCFNIPLLTLVDVPAFLPGKDQEQKGIIRHGAKILFAYAQAKVPRISVILRKAYGGAYIAMNSKTLGADIVYAWPIAEIAVMGAEGAVQILYKKTLAQASSPEKEFERLKTEYEANFLNPDIAEARGFVDEVIFPWETRERLCEAFDVLRNKNIGTDTSVQNHKNIPL